jgi:peroxiredoxin
VKKSVSNAASRASLERRSFLKLGAGVALALPLAACTAEDPLAQQARAGDNKNYIAGDGSVTEYAPEQRGEPVQLTAQLFDGTAVDSKDFAGQVTVLNFWYAACAPCRVEAPDLEALWQEFGPQGAQFYGVNIRDEEATAAAFDRNFNITYPSIKDKDGGVLLAMTQYVPPQAVPTTLVLDREGRVSSRILGLADKGTLKALISDALAV